jgi:Mn2+/Fe2+ NRAMP family transporter
MAFNALVLPIVLGFLLVMANDKKIFGDRRNSRIGNTVAISLSLVCVALGFWYGALTLMGQGS